MTIWKVKSIEDKVFIDETTCDVYMQKHSIPKCNKKKIPVVTISTLSHT